MIDLNTSLECSNKFKQVWHDFYSQEIHLCRDVVEVIVSTPKLDLVTSSAKNQACCF